MKKTAKVLLAVLAAGASVSAAAVAVKKYGGRKKYICKENLFREDEYYPEDEPMGDEYILTPEEEAELTGIDDRDMGIMKDDEPVPVCRRGKYLTADEADFVRFMLKGIENIGTLMDEKVSDIERICRRHTTSAEKVTDIRNLCFDRDDSKELLGLCINDIREVLSGGFPADYFEYIQDRKEGYSDGE